MRVKRLGIMLVVGALSGGGLWIAAAGFRAGSDSEPRTGPSNLIAFTSGEGGYHIETIRPDGGGRVAITDPSGWEYDQAPEWSPDGTKVAFLRYTNLNDERMGDYELFVANADGSEPRNLTETKGAGDFDWAPDGTRLVFSRNVAGSGKDRAHLFVIAVDGSKERQLTESPLYDYAPDWSPDGDEIAFERWLAEDTVELYSASLNGHTERLAGSERGLTKGQPAWSPSGKHIAFVNGGCCLGVLTVDGSDSVHLTHKTGTDIDGLAWSPQGAQVAYSAHERGSWDVYVASLGEWGFEPTKIVSTPADELGPEWSPDGGSLVYSASSDSEGDNSGSFDLYLVSPDGSGRDRLTHDASELGGDLSWNSG